MPSCFHLYNITSNFNDYAVSLESEFVTLTIVDKCTRLWLCGAARLDFDDIHDVFRMRA